jgi:hypothetical protein
MLYPEDEEPLPFKDSGRGAAIVALAAWIALCIVGASSLSHLRITVAPNPAMQRDTLR